MHKGIKKVIILGNEIFSNDIKCNSVKDQKIYILYFDQINLSYENAINLMNKNKVLFINPIEEMRIKNGNYKLGKYGINVYNNTFSIINYDESFASLTASTKINFPMFSTHFYWKILLNHMWINIHIISIIIFFIWLCIYFIFDLSTINIEERQSLINSIST